MHSASRIVRGVIARQCQLMQELFSGAAARLGLIFCSKWHTLVALTNVIFGVGWHVLCSDIDYLTSHECLLVSYRR